MIKKTSETTPTMASVVNTTNSSTTDAYSCKYVNDLYRKLGGTILWTNASPNTTFSSQEVTISENISNYDTFEIVFIFSIGTTRKSSSGLLPDIDARLCNAVGGTLSWRDVYTVNNTKIGFGNGKIAGSNNDDNIIPLYIIGYKTGLF